MTYTVLVTLIYVNSYIVLIQLKKMSTVNGGWSEPNKVSQTSTCGLVTTTWERKCNNPTPKNGGLTCRGDALYTSEETLAPCPGKNLL